MRYRLCRRVDQTVLEPAQTRLNPIPATQPSRLSRTRPDSPMASNLNGRTRQPGLRVLGRGEGFEERPVGFAGVEQGADPVVRKVGEPEGAAFDAFGEVVGGFGGCVCDFGGIVSIVVASLPSDKVASPPSDQVAVLTRILASITAAGLLSLAFVADALQSGEVSAWDFLEDPTARDSFSMVLILLATGASGMLAALVLTVSNPTDSSLNALLAGLARILRCWCAGCLVVATVAVLLLFPAVVVVIITASELAQAP